MASLAETLAAIRAAKAKEAAKQSAKPNIVTNYGVATVTKETARRDKESLNTSAQGTLEAENILQVKNFEAIELDESQAQALEVLKSHKICALTGAAGTGKTTTLRAYIKQCPPQFKWNHMRAGEVTDVLFVSLTGKAVAQMRLVLPENLKRSCMTIHSCLAVFPEEQRDGKMRYVPRYNNENKLGCKRIIIDESTMCSVQLWNQLRDALPEDCTVIFVGDINQLPPVAGQPMLIHALMNFPYATLEKIHRQAENNPVLSACHKILRGQPIETTKGLVLRKVPNDEYEASHAIISKIIALYQAGKYDPMQDQIITAGNSGPLGQEELNAMLLPHLTKFEMHKVFYARRFRIFSVGTKVMYTENDYELGIFNGLQGVIKSIEPNPLREEDFELEAIGFGRELNAEDIADLDDISQYKIDEEQGVSTKETLDEQDAGRQASHIVTVLFNDGTEVKLNRASHMANLQVAFACTCHKMQGSECRKAFIVVHKAQSIHHSREWLYTAVSRAKEAAMLFTSTTITKRKRITVDAEGNSTASRDSTESLNTSIQQCIDSPRILGRTTAEKIKAYYNYTKANAEAEKPRWFTIY